MVSAANPKIELLAPAGNLEKLEIALHYGADAVYLAGRNFSLRNFAQNFSLDQLRTAIDLAHARHAKVYLAVNIFARNEDLQGIEAFLQQAAPLGPDALIAADPAVIMLARRIAPDIAIHLSTQANTTNLQAVRFWQAQGIRRINLAREVPLNDIATITRSCDTQIEAFVHGAMCISYSGRCLLSNYMARRPSNQGSCCQPCRFQYAVVEQTRPGQYFPLAEDERGSYVFNSRDLCMLAHIPAMIDAGICALKIEGRMKSIHYAATAVKIYREAIDQYYQSPANFQIQPYWQQELAKITSRGYCTGFYFADADQVVPQYGAPQPSKFPLAAKVLAPAGPGKAYIEVRNRLRIGDTVEVLRPEGPPVRDRIRQIIDAASQPAATAQPGSRVTIGLNTDCHRLDLLRRCDP